MSSKAELNELRKQALKGLKAALYAVKNAAGAPDLKSTDPGDLPEDLFAEFGDVFYNIFEAYEMLKCNDYDSVNEATSILPSEKTIVKLGEYFPDFDELRFREGVSKANEFVGKFNCVYASKKH